MYKILLLIFYLFLAATAVASQPPIATQHTQTQSNKIKSFRLAPGDLLFQDLNCGTLCNGINQTTSGINHSSISHVTMVYSTSSKTPIIIEAIGKGVTLTPLPTFLQRSKDQFGNPRVIVGRLSKPYRHLIKKALLFSKSQLGKPYNASFIRQFSRGKSPSYYCSELIYDAFLNANHGKSIFNMQPMNFINPQTHHIAQAWQDYFAKLHMPVPQGKLGSNPGEFSKEKIIRIVYKYGKLRTQ